jgi:pimeloyl-ACP methyl ester carboxylesterase
MRHTIFDDLVRLVEAELTEPSTLVAQSMGGIVAVRVALRQPTQVRRLVLVATSGGVDVERLGGWPRCSRVPRCASSLAAHTASRSTTRKK